MGRGGDRYSGAGRNGEHLLHRSRSPAAPAGGIHVPEHVLDAGARQAEHEHARLDAAFVAEAVLPAARAKEERPGAKPYWGGPIGALQDDFAGQHVESFIPVAGAIVTNSGEVLRASALDGVGIAMLPTWAIADDLRSGRLKVVLQGWAPQVSTIHAVYPGNRRMSAKVRAFVDHLARHIGRTPYWERGL